MDAITARAQEMSMAGVRPEIINAFIADAAKRAGVPLTGGEAVAGMPAPVAPAQPGIDQRANATLDRQTYGTTAPAGAIQSGPTTAQRAAAEARVAAETTRARIEAEGRERVATPEELARLGYKPGDVVAISPSGVPRMVQAAPKPPEQVARDEAMVKEVPGLQDARNAFMRYRNLVEQYGTEQLPGFLGGNKAQLQAAYGTARDAIRVLGNTGTLNIGELPFLEERLAPATNYLGALGGNMTGSAIISQIDENLRFLDEKEARIRGMSYEEFVARRNRGEIGPSANQSAPTQQPAPQQQGGIRIISVTPVGQ
jgi:hypothetical protein